MLAVLVKEFIQLTRDRLTYAMLLGVPVVQLLLFGYAINTDPRHLPTAVLVQEDSVFARSILSSIRNSGYFEFVAQARNPAELDRLAAELLKDPAVEMAAPFGLALHVSGSDPEALERALEPWRQPPFQWTRTEPTLEDVFIHLMGGAEDNFQ